ncbi:LysR substrate-binding domain-containing protein [Rhodococcus opacus]|uniref:LysR substrate-binding domain-containing protein n=1 Tax=Rhodococcus opacus TaxID=37919 RepID=UPI0029543256|nr:LysR substrate-binding domain-containing protein [Rhodococcus opacus]MDV7090515.1 LysR substrate-binding domain-containing protein [Rhodococcus opacus]
MMLQVNRLRLLCELHRRGTLAAVASALSYSPSAVSQQLRQLEREVGAILLEPVGRGVRLTEQDLILVEHGNRVLGLLEQAEAEVVASLGQIRGTVRVAAFQTAALALVPGMLAELRKRHPLVDVEFTQGEPTETVPALASAEYDLVVIESYPGYPPRIPEGIHVDKLMTDPLWLVIPNTIASTIDPENDVIAQLSGAKWAMELAESVPGMWIREQCRRAGFSPSIMCKSEDLLVHRYLAEEGLVVAVLPGLALHHLDSSTARYPVGPELTCREVQVATRSTARTSPAVSAVHDALIRSAQSLTHEMPA